MTLVLYHKLYSPPCRATILTLMALNITYVKRIVHTNVVKVNRHDKEFEKKNPHHTIPMIEEDDFILWDSQAINTYLANKYDLDHHYYPKDLRKRAIVDHRLYFNNEKLFPFLRDYTRQIVRYGKVTTVTSEHVKQFNEMYSLVNVLFSSNRLHGESPKSRYIAGDILTIADFHIVTTISTMEIFVPVEMEKFPDLVIYLNLCKVTMPNYVDVNVPGVEDFRHYVSVPSFKFPPAKW